MHSTVGLDHLTTGELIAWQVRLTEELGADFESAPLRLRAEKFARQMLRVIEATLSRRGETKRPPEFEATAAESHDQHAMEAVHS